MLSDNLKKYREKRGYSKRNLAKVSGVSRETIKKIENTDDWKNTKLSTIERLAKVLDITIIDLIK